MTPLLNNVISEIRREMDLQGINQVELARRMGKTKGHVNQILNGRRNMNLSTVAEISNALGFQFVFVKSVGVELEPYEGTQAKDDEILVT